MNDALDAAADDVEVYLAAFFEMFGALSLNSFHADTLPPNRFDMEGDCD